MEKSVAVLIKTIQQYREIVVGLLMMLLLSIILPFLTGFFDVNMTDAGKWCSAIGLQAVLLSVITLAVIYLEEERKLGAIGLKLPTYNRVKQAVLHGGLLFMVMYGLSIVLTFLVHDMEVQAVIRPIMQIDGLWQKVLVLVIGAVLVPFSEELLFRGYIYGGLNSRMSSKKAMVATAILFAILHGDLYRFLLFFIGGLWLNIIYVRSGSLWSSVIAHGIWNGLMIGLMIFS